MINLADFDGIIFDYGGVLVLHQTDAQRAEMAKLAGMEPAQFDAAYWGERVPYDRGLITAEEYWSKVASSASVELTNNRMEQLTEADSVSWMVFDEPMWTFIKDLRQAGKKVAILSNMPLDLGETLKARTDRLNMFDHVTLSYELRSAKPDPAIYESCLEGLGTPPDRTLFFDDRVENITGAEALGIRGVQFTSREEVLIRLTPFSQVIL